MKVWPWNSMAHSRRLAAQEVDELCEEWQPEPLCGPLPAAQRDYEPPVISRWAATASAATAQVLR